MNAIQIQALKYIKQGLSIIPVGKDKRPLIKWQEFQKRIATEAEVNQWFETYPDMQIAIVTGKISNLFVVDIDDETIDRSSLPLTRIIKTPKGYHYYYTHCDNIKNTAKKIDGVDTRGEGGYVLAVPSSNEKGNYTWYNQLPRVEFKKELETNFKEKETKTFIPMQSEYYGYGEGQRNAEMTRYIGHVLTKIHPAKWETIAWREIQEANQKNTPPLPEWELHNTFNSISQKERSNSITRFYKDKEQVDKEEFSEESIEVVPIEQALENNGKLTEAFSMGYAGLDKQMEGGIRKAEVMVITGLSGGGKSMLMQNLTLNFLERAKACLWLTYELSNNDIWNNLKNMRPDISLNKLITPKNTHTGSLTWIKKIIIKAKKDYNTEFVFIDDLDYLSPMKKMDAEQTRLIIKRIMVELNILATELGISIFLTAHVKKLLYGRNRIMMQDLSESSAIFQKPAYCLAIQQTKIKQNLHGETIEVERNEGSLYFIKQRRRMDKKDIYFKVAENKYIIPIIEGDGIL